VLPVVFLYAKRRALTPIIGKNVTGDPDLHIDLYNLISEVRELLRTQTFSILNVPIGTDQGASVEREMGIMGRQSGTANVLFSTQPAQYVTPEGTNVEVYHEHIDRLVRMIYRLASCPWESDSKDAEAEGSMQLKRQDMQNTLKKYAGELQRADDRLTELFYRAMHGEKGWQRVRDKDGLSVAYPDTFEVPDFEQVAKEATALIGIEPGETASKEIKKRVTFAYLNDIDADMRQQISAEIEAVKVETEAEKRDALLAKTAARMGRPAA
jgi:hypothetical protein